LNPLPKELQSLVALLSCLPNFGPKSSERIALYLLKSDDDYIEKLSKSISDIKSKIGLCKICQNFSSGEICSICSDESRDHSKICIVEDPMDSYAIERGGFYNGTYHVLHGVVDPLNHIELDELKIASLYKRVENSGISELILATNPDSKGETTALYIERMFKKFPNLKITRIAYGLPRGADIEYADEVTLRASFENRKEY